MKNCTYIPVEFIALAEVMVGLVEEKLRGFKFNTVCPKNKQTPFVGHFFPHTCTNKCSLKWGI